MALKAAVKEHWEGEMCETRYGSAADRKLYFDEISAGRNLMLYLRCGLSPSDLLAVKPSKKYGSPIYKLLRRFYPRWLVRLVGDRYGLGLLLEAKKPALGLGAMRNGER